MSSTLPRYRMRLSLNVLQHLGLSLYSNVPSVLSEAVANAWDADASRVDITLNSDEGQIVIQDDGSGMTQADVNDRFLFVGYVRRTEQRGRTPLMAREPMGRKGIGKLSLFSIANEIVVETARNEERNALRMTLSGIQAAIGSQSPSDSAQYQPEELPTSGIDFGQGTRITLSNLRKRQTLSTAEGLRKRLARRFSIIGPSHHFEVAVNDTVDASGGEVGLRVLAADLTVTEAACVFWPKSSVGWLRNCGLGRALRSRTGSIQMACPNRAAESGCRSSGATCRRLP